MKAALPGKKEKKKAKDEPILTQSKISTDPIATRAYHAWLERGCTHGFDVEDWLEAERQILREELLISDSSDAV